MKVKRKVYYSQSNMLKASDEAKSELCGHDEVKFHIAEIQDLEYSLVILKNESVIEFFVPIFKD